MNSNLEIRLAESVKYIEINRPEKKNAITGNMYLAMAEALASGDEDDKVRVMVIAGQDSIFTAGNDIQDFLSSKPSSIEGAPAIRFLDTLQSVRKPVVAIVQGSAVGIGTTLLLHCDFVFASSKARFQMPFVSLGLCPEAGSSLLLPLLAGYAKAADLLIFGESFDAAEARRICLVTTVLDQEDLPNYVSERIKLLAALPPAAVRSTKKLLRQAQASQLKKTMQLEGQEFVTRISSDEAKEAFSAFLGKRKPDFSNFF